MEKSGNFYIEEAESDFKRVHKSIILNKDIDCLTLGIYVKILVLGKKWQLNIKGLSSYFDISDMKIRKSISLLEKEGYISRKAVQDEKTGKLAGWNYTLHAIPLEESKRTCAGRKNNEETVYPEIRQHGYPTTRLSDNTETGEDNNNKLKEDINLKEIDKPNQYKEDKDKSLSKKDDYLPFAAEPQPEYGDKTKKKRNTTPKDDPLFEECWKAYKRRGNKAKAKVYWDKINEEERKNILPHIKAYVQSRDRQYQSYFERYLRDKGFNDVVYKGNSILYDPERYKEGNNIYMPYTEGYHLWLNENDGKYYFTGNIINLADGYTKENRPNGAQVHQNGYTYTWNATSKEWERG